MRRRSGNLIRIADPAFPFSSRWSVLATLRREEIGPTRRLPQLSSISRVAQYAFDQLRRSCGWSSRTIDSNDDWKWRWHRLCRFYQYSTSTTKETRILTNLEYNRNQSISWKLGRNERLTGFIVKLPSNVLCLFGRYEYWQHGIDVWLTSWRDTHSYRRQTLDEGINSSTYIEGKRDNEHIIWLENNSE